jgi:methylmalonyl-CoA mutase cobalamin-binding subunit
MEDMAALEAQGYAKLFGPGTRTEEIAIWIQGEMQKRWKSEGAQ